MKEANQMRTAAVIGCGKRGEGQVGWAIGHMHGFGYKHAKQQVKLLGVDLSRENLSAFGSAFALPDEQLFDSTEALYSAGIPDIVSICTWPGLHAPMAIEAMDKGVKGLVIEKPLALDMDQVHSIRKKVADTGAIVVVAHQRRYGAYFRTLKRVVDENRLGDGLRIEARVGDGWDILSWTTHWFDMANFLLGTPPLYVLAGAQVTDKRIYGHAAEDASIIFAEYPEGRSATFCTGPMSGFDLRLIGNEGSAFCKEGAVVIATADGVERIAFEELPYEKSFVPLMDDLLAAMDGGDLPLCSLESCASATEMAYAAHESARIRRKVELPMATRFAPLEVLQHLTLPVLEGRRLLLYADSHFGSGGAEGIADALMSLTGEKPRQVDAEITGLKPEHLEGIDAILIYHTQKDADETTRRLLEDWVAAGKPICITHAGLGAWPEWPVYQAWCGYIWEWGVSTHPHVPATLRPVATGAVDFGFAEAWLPRDEVFIRLKETSPVALHLTAEISGDGIYPAAWHLKDHPHVAAWMPGHRRDSWEVPAMRQGFETVLKRLFIP